MDQRWRWIKCLTTVSADCTKRRAGLRLSKHQQHRHHHQQLNRKATNKKNKINKKGIFLIPKVFSVQVDLFVCAGGLYCTKKKKGGKGNQVQIKISKLAFFIRERGKSPLPPTASFSLHSIDAATTSTITTTASKCVTALLHRAAEGSTHRKRGKEKKIARELRFDQKATQLQVENGRTDGWTGDESGARGRWRREMASVCVCCCVLESILNEQG